MNRFVMVYSVGDGCTYSCEVVVPIEADSKEEIYVKFSEEAMRVRQEYEEHVEKRHELLRNACGPNYWHKETPTEVLAKTNELRTNTDFKLFGRKFDASDFTSHLETVKVKKKGRDEVTIGDVQFDSGNVEIFTLDEWFANGKTE